MIKQKFVEKIRQRKLTEHINKGMLQPRNQTFLTRHFGKEHVWNFLLGIPIDEHQKNWDSYGEFYDDNTKSYYMTGRFGFTGHWQAGRLPYCSLNEAMELAFENCDIKEKWKRMVIWNRLFDCSVETLEFLKATTKCERKHHVICKLLEAKLKRTQEKQKDDIFKQKVEELYIKFDKITVEFTDGTKMPLNSKCLVSHDTKHKQGGKMWTENTLKKNVFPLLLKEVNEV